MATSTVRDTAAAELTQRLDPITSRLWMLRGSPAALPARRLAAGIVLAPQALAYDDAKAPSIGAGMLLH